MTLFEKSSKVSNAVTAAPPSTMSAEDVDWIVMDTHPFAGHYHGRAAFISGTFAKLAHVLPQGARLQVEHLIVKDDQAVVGHRSLATAKSGMRFDIAIAGSCLSPATESCAFEPLDSVMVGQSFEENPLA